MSWQIFKRLSNRILLIEGKHSSAPSTYKVKASWYAHNDTSSNSNGPWPNGTYNYVTYNPHLEMGLQPACFRTAYGCFGIHIFNVPGRSGMGVHSGRTFGEPDVAKGKTLGCIRIPSNAMDIINQTHNTDPLERIIVTD